MAQSSLYDNVLGTLLDKMEILRKMLQYIKNKAKRNRKLKINFGKNIQVKLITLYSNKAKSIFKESDNISKV